MRSIKPYNKLSHQEVPVRSCYILAAKETVKMYPSSWPVNVNWVVELVFTSFADMWRPKKRCDRWAFGAREWENTENKVRATSRRSSSRVHRGCRGRKTGLFQIRFLPVWFINIHAQKIVSREGSPDARTRGPLMVIYLKQLLCSKHVCTLFYSDFYLLIGGFRNPAFKISHLKSHSGSYYAHFAHICGNKKCFMWFFNVFWA